MCKYLKRYLNWIQNSLLEGEVTKSELEEIKNNLTKLIEMEKDHIVIYELRSNDLFIKESIGKAKLDTSNIIWFIIVVDVYIQDQELPIHDKKCLLFHNNEHNLDRFEFD